MQRRPTSKWTATWISQSNCNKATRNEQNITATQLQYCDNKALQPADYCKPVWKLLKKITTKRLPLQQHIYIYAHICIHVYDTGTVTNMQKSRPTRVQLLKLKYTTISTNPNAQTNNNKYNFNANSQVNAQ